MSSRSIGQADPSGTFGAVGDGSSGSADPVESAVPAAAVPAGVDTETASDSARLRLRSLVQLARSLSEPRSFEDLIALAAHEIRFALSATTVSVRRFEPDRGLLRTLVNVGDLAPGEEFRPADEVLQVGDLVRARLLIDEAASWVFDPDFPERFPAAAAALRTSGKTFAMAAPILLDGRVWGEVYLTRDAVGPQFAQDDVDLVEALCAVMSSSIALASRVSLVEQLAYLDPLTGLANRRAVDLRLEEALDARGESDRPVSVVMADVNGLKQVNDLGGHEEGDRVLVAVANTIAFAVSQTDCGLGGRMGGDEFCIVLDGMDGPGAVAVAQGILDRLAEAGLPRVLSCGVASTALLPAGRPVTARQLLRWADEAQYTAKRAALSVPVLAGRDALELPATERRTLRGGGHHETPLQQVLVAGLHAIEAAGTDPKLRLVRLLDTLCDSLGAAGWVLSTIDFGDNLSRTVAFAQAGESSRPEAIVPLEGWVEQARTTGVLCRTTDASSPLADARAMPVVAAAVVGPWLLELLAAHDGVLDDLPPVLRVLGAAALVDL